MQKLVLKLDIHDNSDKKKVMKLVAGILGIDSVEVDLKEQKLTATGDFDPVEVVTKLRKQSWRADMVSVGPAKKDEGGEKKKDSTGVVLDPANYYYPLPIQPVTYNWFPTDENPSTCVIC